jgi:hypothetical protein
MRALTWENILKLIGATCVTVGYALPQSASSVDLDNFPPRDTIVRDVCIIGGGSTGTFSAIRFRDQGKSVAVIERKNRLGGHTETYQDPVTGLKTDAGVDVWNNLPIVNEYFARFNIPLVNVNVLASNPGLTTLFVDFTTGKQVDFTPPDPTPAFIAYAAQLAKYPFLENGFDLPDPVPADLLLPFGDFVAKYDLHAMVMFVFAIGQGYGDLLSQPTLYVMKLVGATVLRSLSEGFLATAHADNSEIYVKALAELGSDALLNSQIIATKRGGNSIKVLIKTPSGLKLVKAKRLLVTIPPKLDNLQGFDLDTTEASLFSQFHNAAYYTFVFRNTGIPQDTSLLNIGVNTSESLPNLPGIYAINPTGIPNLVNVKYGSPTVLPDDQVKSDVFHSLALLRTAGTVQTTTPEIAFYSAHVPFELTVSVSAIANGFYRHLNALQGHRNTFYTGAAFDTHDSAGLWKYTDTILPKVFGGK